MQHERGTVYDHSSQSTSQSQELSRIVPFHFPSTIPYNKEDAKAVQDIASSIAERIRRPGPKSPDTGLAAFAIQTPACTVCPILRQDARWNASRPPMYDCMQT